MKTAAVIHELIGGSPFIYVADRQQDGQIQKVYLWVNQHGNIEYEIESYMTLRKDARPCDTQHGIGIPIRSVEEFQELEWTVYEQTYDLPGILQKIQGARDELVLCLAGEDNTPWCRGTFDEIVSTMFHRFGNQAAEILLEGKWSVVL